MPDWNETTDYVVIGSGAGSMVAALRAAALGHSTIILEKQALIGGSTGWSGGVMWIPANPLMARAGVADSLDQARAYIAATAPERDAASSDARIEAYLRSGPELVTFLERSGFVFRRPDGYPDYYTTAPGAMASPRTLMPELFDAARLGPWRDKLSLYPGPRLPLRIDELTHLMMMKRTWKGRRTLLTLLRRLLTEKLTGRHYLGAGGSLQGRMLERTLAAGITPRTEWPVTGLIEEDGRVAGVVAMHDGVPHRIRAHRAVIIDAGGFSHNAALRRAHDDRLSSSDWSSANPGDTGEMTRAAIALGAATANMDEAIWSMISLGPDRVLPPGATQPNGAPLHFAHHFDISYPHCIVVDQGGRRFANEAGSYMEMGQRLRARHAALGGEVPGWAIIESRHRDRYAWARTLGKTPQDWIDSGYMIRADSIAELADRCGIDRAELEEEVARFNGFARDGHDADFGRGAAAFDNFHGDSSHRPNPNLGAIEQPPFYAVRIYPGDVGTAGGLVTDENARVLRDDGSAIAGLYAVGNAAASLFGRAYIGGGTSIASAMIFAMRAVDAAAEA